MAANLYFKTERYEEAIDSYSELISIDTLNGRFYFRRGYSLIQTNNHLLAVPDYLKSARLGYREFDSYYTLGTLYMIVLDNDSLALKYLEKCVALDSTSSEVKKMISDMKGRNIINL